MNKKKIILTTICIAIALIFAICMVSIAGYSIGATKKIGVKVSDTNVIDLIDEMNYFCGFNGVELGCYYSPKSYKNIATVTIKGKQTKVKVQGVENELTGNDSKSSMVLASVYNQIKNDTNRERYVETVNNQVGFAFSFDYGQAAIWYGFGNWNSEVGQKINNSKWNTIKGALGTKIISGLDTSWKNYSELVAKQKLAFTKGNEIYTNASDTVSQLEGVGNTEYGIKEAYYDLANNNTQEKTVNECLSKVIDGKEYTIVGPFKYQFVDTIANNKPTLTFDSGTTAQDYKLLQYTGSVWQETTIRSNSAFYIAVESSKLANVTKINLGFQVNGISLNNTTTTINIFLQENSAETYQPIIYFEQVEGYYSPFKNTYTLPKAEISLEKLDVNGNKINIQGIKFELKDNGTTIAYFKTDANGNVIVVDKNGNAVGKNTVTIITEQNHEYELVEIINPGYGYDKIDLNESNVQIDGATIKGVGNNSITFKLNRSSGNVKIKIKNKQELGHLAVEKHDVLNNDIKLSGVGFKLEIFDGNSTKYIQLRDKNYKVVTSVTGTTTINNINIANANEYHVEYVAAKDRATEFVTGTDGKLAVNNLEVYNRNGTKYKYKLIEARNENSQYESNVIVENIELISNETVTKQVANTQLYIDISGYVWKELPTKKSNTYDHVYTGTEESKDIMLKDLYGVDEKALIPVEIKLRNAYTKEYIKMQPDQFDNATGEYTFKDVEISKLVSLEVVFIYNGFEYTTTIANLDVQNGSKVVEDKEQRVNLNSQFEVVNSDTSVIYNTVQNGSYQTSTAIGFGDGITTTIEATTNKAGIDLAKTYLDNIRNSNSTIDKINNINMGIVQREQPKLALGSDIYSVSVEVDGHNYDYYYGSRQYENINADEVGVKFEQEGVKNRYSRTVYSSDVEALAEGRLEKGMSVSIIYKISMMNQSTSLTSVVNEITNYFDAEYKVEAIGSAIEGVTMSNQSNYQHTEAAETTVGGYKATKITFGDSGVALSAGQAKNVYIKFSVSQSAITGLLTKKSTYHNATEITSYSTLYGENTNTQTDSENNREYFSTDQSEAGAIYAGIDKASKPGNIELILTDYINSEGMADGTKVLDTTCFEDDTTSAPSLLLEATESRRISGKVFEDETAYSDRNGRLGNGIYDSVESAVQNVIVELHKLNDDGTVGEIATYSNSAEVKATTNTNGDYTFGYYDSENQKHVGVLPGRYVIKYTYNNQSTIGDAPININYYKSTIITSDAVKNGFESSNERWYVTDDSNRYSDAVDKYELRPEYNTEIDQSMTVTNASYNNVLNITSMDAYTPAMDIGLEFTATNETRNANEATIVKELKNVDFGIAERAKVAMTIDKKITALEIISQNGTAIIAKGNPAEVSAQMQRVKNLESEDTKQQLVSAEIETNILQGAQLNIEYTITVKNDSEIDFLDKEYYYYGIPGTTKSEPTVKTVIDYLDATMEIDIERSQDWTIVKASDLYSDDGNNLNDLVSKEVYDVISNGEYNIAITNAFEEVYGGESKSVQIYASKMLATGPDEMREENKVEIIEITGKRAIYDSTPGNYIPTEIAKESDVDEAVIVITPPTGTTIDYMSYIIATIVTLTILALGTLIIKMKIIE